MPMKWLEKYLKIAVAKVGEMGDALLPNLKHIIYQLIRNKW